MIKQLNIILLLPLLLILLHNSPAYSLKKLSGSEMKGTVAQSGITFGVTNTGIHNSSDTIRFENPHEIDSYLEFGDVESFTLATSNISVDLEEIGGRSYVSISTSDMDLTSSMTIGEVNYCGTDIGSMRIEDSTVSSFNLAIGAHDTGAGFDIGLEFASRTELIEFQYNDAPLDPSNTGTLAISGLTFAESFTGDVASGEFLIGSLGNNKKYAPIQFDLVNGSSSNGANPNNHVSLKIGAIEGSVRIDNINFGGNDMGHVRMDGINITRLDIEFPGRGLGRPE